MFEQKRFKELDNSEVLMNSVNVSYLTGNATLDSSQLDVGSVIKKGTAIFKNEDTGLFELVADGEEGGTPETMKLPCLTAETIRVEEGNNYVSAWQSGHPIEELCTGVTDNFKRANPNFQYY